MKYMPLMSQSYKIRIRYAEKQLPLSWAQTIPTAIAHTLSDTICRRVRNSNMMEDQNLRFNMSDCICITPHTSRYLGDFVCTDQIGRN